MGTLIQMSHMDSPDVPCPFIYQIKGDTGNHMQKLCIISTTLYRWTLIFQKIVAIPMMVVSKKTIKNRYGSMGQNSRGSCGLFFKDMCSKHNTVACHGSNEENTKDVSLVNTEKVLWPSSQCNKVRQCSVAHHISLIHPVYHQNNRP